MNADCGGTGRRFSSAAESATGTRALPYGTAGYYTSAT
jgi:hypothetical protein